MTRDMTAGKTLGEGSTAKIKKIKHNGRICVSKVLSIKERGRDRIKKEIFIHQSLCSGPPYHPFIIRLLDEYEENGTHCMILEYGPYYLRALIEQRLKEQRQGLSAEVAHMFFVQLIQAVKFLHERGICHRDIKPENILIGYDGNIKLSDFGSSTFFIAKRRRRLKSCSGSYEFMAPEVLSGNYDGASADIWSCGITLLNMLTGSLPWSRADFADERYAAFRKLDYHHYEPFSKLPGAAAELIKGMLAEEKDRWGIDRIESHVWFKAANRLMDKGKLCANNEYLSGCIEQGSELYFTQPDETGSRGCFLPSSVPTATSGNFSFHRLYLQMTPGSAVQNIIEVLDEMAVVSSLNSDCIAFSTTDTRRNKLSGAIVVEALGTNSVATITKSAGDVHEFLKFTRYFDQNFA